MIDYEQKYKEALERAREFQKSKDGLCVLTAESIFPELGESKDERIRKALVRFHKSTIDVDGIKGEEIVAWLEKQGEKKPADKVEPKFKVGDWVVQENIGVYKVIEICESWYEVVDNKDKHYSIGFDKEYMCHLWTIEDAKDGDVLVSKYNKPFIYNGNYNDRFVDAHCGLNFDGKFKLAWENCSWTNNKNIHPASEGQCGLLSQKMKEAGYEWDMEKKELKLLISNGGDFESNNSKQNPTWSEEDENVLEDIEEAIINYWHGDTQNILLDWLKSLKERLS